MNEEQIMGALTTLRDAILQCVDHIKEVEKKVDESVASADEKINELRSTVYDQIINPANEYISEMDRNARFDEFNEKYGDKLRPFNEDLSALEGDDFDIVRQAFDQYDGFEGDKMGEDEYVEALVEEVGKKLDAIKKSLGVPADTEIAVEQTEDGDTVITTEDGDVIASEGEETEVEAPAEEEEVAEEETPEDDPEEIAAFEEELKNQK